MIKFLENNVVLVALLIVALFVTMIFVINRAFQPTMDDIEWREMTHTVLEGDTLWSIASEYCPDSVDRRGHGAERHGEQHDPPRTEADRPASRRLRR